MAVSQLTYRTTGSTAITTASQTINVAKPTGLAVGDLMIAQIAWRINGTISAPAGWTASTAGTVSGGTTRAQAIFWRIATSGDVAASTFAFTTAGTAANGIGAIHAFSDGYNATSPLDQATGVSNAAATNTATALTPGQPNEVIMILAMAQNNDGSPYSAWAITTTDPGSWTEVIDSSNLTGNVSIGAAYSLPRSAVTSTGTGSVTLTVNRANVMHMISIRTPSQGFGQSQADIKAVGQGFGQAEADIKAVGRGFGQSQADIKAVGTGFGQTQASIKSTQKGFAQAQALIISIARLVQQKAFRNSGNGSTLTLDATPIAGNTLVVFTSYGNTSGSPTFASGQGGATTWVQEVSKGNSFNAYAFNRGYIDGTPSASIAFTTIGSSDTYEMLVQEWAGLYPLVDVDDSGSSGSSSPASDSITTTHAKTLIFTGFGNRIDITTATLNQTTGVVDNGPVTATSPLLRTAYRLEQATGTYTTSWTITPSSWAAASVSYVVTGLEIRGFGQAKADIKAKSYGFGQAQASIRPISRGFAQAQAWIAGPYVDVDNGDLLADFSGVDGVWTLSPFTANIGNVAVIAASVDEQGSADISDDQSNDWLTWSEVIDFGSGKVKAYLWATEIKATGPVQVTIVTDGARNLVAIGSVFHATPDTGMILKIVSKNQVTAGNTIPASTSFPSPVNFGYTIPAVEYGTGMNLAVDIVYADTQPAIVFGFGRGFSDVDFGITGDVTDPTYLVGSNGSNFAQSGSIAINARRSISPVIGQDQNFSGFNLDTVDHVLKENYIIIHETIPVAYGFGQAQANIKAVAFGFGQANADIKAKSYGFGQANADIKATNYGFGQAQADIKATSFGFAQSNADIKAIFFGFAQTQADIKAVGYGFGQSQSDIKATSQGYAQAQSDIKAINKTYAQAQADINATSYGFGQAQSDVKATGRGFAQSQADIKATEYGFGQANADILATINQFGQAQADITNASYGFGQAQADIDTANQGYGQAQGYIEVTITSSYGFGQSQADIKATNNGYGQSQSDIKAINDGYGQSQADIKQTYNGFGQAQGTILATSDGFGQSNADIKTMYQNCAQAQANIKQTYFGFGQAQGQISNSPQGYGNAQGLIKASVTQSGQAQSDILVTQLQFGQSQAEIKQTYLAFGQVNSYITRSEQGYGQTQSDIKATYNKSGQAQADVLATSYGVGNAQADIKATINSYAQVQASIKVRAFNSAQAQADILATNYGFAQTQAFIIRHEGFAQAQAFILQPHYLKNVTVTDEHSTRVAVTDEASDFAISDVRTFSLRVWDEHSIKVTLSTERFQLLEVSDAEY